MLNIFCSTLLPLSAPSALNTLYSLLLENLFTSLTALSIPSSSSSLKYFFSTTLKLLLGSKLVTTAVDELSVSATISEYSTSSNYTLKSPIV